MRKVNVLEAAEDILLRKAAAVSLLSAEKKEHFFYLLDLLLNCYSTESSRALVLFSEGIDEDERLSLLAVNADQSQTEELIDTLCVFRKLDFSENRPVAN